MANDATQSAPFSLSDLASQSVKEQGFQGQRFSGSHASTPPSQPLTQRTSQSASADAGGDMDFQKVAADLKAQNAQLLEKLGQSENAYSTLSEEHKESKGILDKLKGVFTPEKEPDPKERHKQMIDRILEQSIEDQKQGGTGLPMTTEIGVTTHQFIMDQIEQNQKLMDRIEQLEQQNQSQFDPRFQADQRVYYEIDGLVQTNLDRLYGLDSKADTVKAAQFKAITNRMSQDVKYLQQNEPEKWEQIRRTPRLRQQMVDHYVKQTVPPKLIEMAQEKHIQETPMQPDELLRAFREAGQIEDPEQRSKLRAQIRKELLSAQLTGPNGRMRVG